ncbi:MAG: DUF3325 domain-containing protein [Gammaproteobacteria bacterium]|nr:MAG: DUF3325 domain-containing protein [Gammaproteobacteria bacterium]
MANVLLLIAILLCVLGMAWLALAMEAHWKQVRSDKVSEKTVRLLRYLGGASVFASLLFCLAVDHPTMASLVWIMLLAASALIVAFTFTLRPRLLAPLVGWVRVAS